MSMSQEEIESLMNGIDLGDDQASSEESTEESSAPMSEDDIANLIAETDEIKSEEPAAQVDDSSDNEQVSSDDIDKLLAEMSDEPEEQANEEVSSDDIDALMASIESMDDPKVETAVEETSEVETPAVEEPATTEAASDNVQVSADDIEALLQQNLSEEEPETSDDNIDAVLASLEAEGSLQESAPAVEKSVEAPSVEETPKSTVSLTSGDEGSKVVNQLSQVANDSEEKAVKILDVLGEIMDSNYEHINELRALNDFMASQDELLMTLTQKFPNVAQFSDAKAKLDGLKDKPSSIISTLEGENTELFTAMELMQYHDINRQKIERVMSVIRKLSLYLNDIFEDTQAHEISNPVAKHIHGDQSADLVGNDDLDALISEFSKS